jgi:hypothetical protein
MKIKRILFMGLVFLILCMGNNSLAQENIKLAQTGFQFLSVISDAKAAGMAGAVNSLEIGSGSLFFNPACLAGMKGYGEITASKNDWIADIKHMQFSAAVSLGDYGAAGISLQSVDYGEFYKTIVGGPEGYTDLGTFSLQSFSVGLGYAKKLSDQFSVGGQVKYVHQDLGDGIVPRSRSVYDTLAGGLRATTVESFKLNPISFDFGTLFKTGIKSLAFGMSVRHFSGEIKYSEEKFQLPLIFTLGISMDVMDFVDQAEKNHSLIVSIDATHDRSYPEQLLIGVDYTLMNMLSIRVGYISRDDLEKFSYGVGVSKFGLELDYAYTPTEYFVNVQRITARFKI